MPILVDYSFCCEGCHEVVVLEYDNLHAYDRPPDIKLPLGWNGVDTGKVLCPKCLGPDHVH